MLRWPEDRSKNIQLKLIWAKNVLGYETEKSKDRNDFRHDLLTRGSNNIISTVISFHFFYSDCFLWVISIIRQVLCAYYFQVQVLHGKVVYILKIKTAQGWIVWLNYLDRGQDLIPEPITIAERISCVDCSRPGLHVVP